MKMASETKFLIQPPSPLSLSSAKMVGQQQASCDETNLKVMQQSPYYLCTVTCCDSENCIDHPPTYSTNNNNNNKLTTNNTMNKFQHLYEPTTTTTTTLLCQSTNNNSNINNHNDNNFKNNILDFGTTRRTSTPRQASPSLLDSSMIMANNNNNHINNNSHLDCELCNQQQQQQQQEKHGKNPRILWADPMILAKSDPGNRNPIGGGGGGGGSIMVNHHYDDLSPIKINEEPCNNNNLNLANSTFGRNNNKLKLKSLANNPAMVVETRIQSPEMSSTSPIGNNSSNTTEYTELFTPTPAATCQSVNGHTNNNANNNNNGNNLIIQPLFKINNLDHNNKINKIHNHDDDDNHSRNDLGNPSALDYRLYFMNDAEKHGFFRKAVPTLPLAIAVMFCIMNLILPGSGTFLASVAIIFGSKTEYGPGCGYQAFLICFLSSILQFTTAIFVFGWVWSIMWGIVFIKNSLRYGHERDIHTISLC